MSSTPSRGVGHGGPPSDPASDQEADARHRESVAHGIRSEDQGDPVSTPAAKNPRLAATLMGISAPPLSAEREKPTAVDSDVHLPAESNQRLGTAAPAAVAVDPDDAITTTIRMPNLGERSKPHAANPEATVEAVKRTEDQGSEGRRVLADPDGDDHDYDEGDDEVAGSSVLGRCLIGAAVGATVAILLVAVVRTRARADGAQDLEKPGEMPARPVISVPNWKEVPTSPTIAPAVEAPPFPGDLTGSDGPSESVADRSRPGHVPAPRPRATIPGAIEVPTGRGSGAPTPATSPPADPIRGGTSSRHLPPRSGSGPSMGEKGESVPEANSNPSWRRDLAVPSANSPAEKVKSKTGPGSDPDLTLPPTTD